MNISQDGIDFQPGRPVSIKRSEFTPEVQENIALAAMGIRTPEPETPAVDPMTEAERTELQNFRTVFSRPGVAEAAANMIMGGSNMPPAQPQPQPQPVMQPQPTQQPPAAPPQNEQVMQPAQAGSIETPPAGQASQGGNDWLRELGIISDAGQDGTPAAGAPQGQVQNDPGSQNVQPQPIANPQPAQNEQPAQNTAIPPQGQAAPAAPAVAEDTVQYVNAVSAAAIKNGLNASDVVQTLQNLSPEKALEVYQYLKTQSQPQGPSVPSVTEAPRPSGQIRQNNNSTFFGPGNGHDGFRI